MQKFIIKPITTKNIESELEKIGFDIAYRTKASEKYQYKTLKIFSLTLPQANILKQTALSLGADCGVHREVLTSKIDKTDAILGGSLSQLKKICQKLKEQPFSLKILAEEILLQLEQSEKKTKLVGVLNITPDSFSDGGNYLLEKDAIEHFYKLIKDGADIIDIGAESTKPFSKKIDPKIQIERLAPVLKELKNSTVPVSVDTTSSEVAQFALDCGAKIINDVSGGTYDSKILDVVSKYDAGIILQHSTANAEDRPCYKDIIEDVYFSLSEKANLAREKGIKNVILDVGIGFGKSQEENFEILNRIEEFYSLEKPIMVGVSRKSLLNAESEDNNTKDALSAAISYPLVQRKIDYLRVHNVLLHKQLLNLAI